MPNRKVPSDEELKRLYVEDQLSAPEIGERLGLSPATIQGALRRISDLVMRTNSEAQRLAAQKGRKASPAYWLGKKQPADMVERRAAAIRGEKHYLWKGGDSRRGYRKVVRKDKCDECDATENLCIHHINFDHYDNRPENLQVLCVHCHLSLHKTHYWDCYRKGIPHKTSTAPNHWLKGGEQG